MSPEEIRAILDDLAAGKLDAENAYNRLHQFPVDVVQEQGHVVARIDTMRESRQGFPEVILAEGKKFSHLKAVVERALNHGKNLLVTRVTLERADRLLEELPDLKYNPHARCLYRRLENTKSEGLIGVLTGGTSDIPVAEEAALTASLMGARVETHYDTGVAGLHRLLGASNVLKHARVLVVAAGMEGALPSVIGGLVNKPVIAVPTSVGYGASFQGLAALLGMLNSCSSNVVVVNIDNGFGAGYTAGLINRLGNPDELPPVQEVPRAGGGSGHCMSC